MTSPREGLLNTLIRSNAYKFIKTLGHGSYAKVYLAEFFDASLEKVACKVIETSRAPNEYVKKFLPRELDTLRRLNHPHIIRLQAIYRKNDQYIIFMRYAEKGDLLDVINKIGPINENQARMWVKQISLAIQYLHELEIAHRDLKCENILVTANYNAKLADFGFSKFLLNKRGIRTLSETYCGSPLYCAPEILRGNPYNPKLADMWSLGVVIFVMLNKSLPFEGVQSKKIYEQQIKKTWTFKPSVEVSWQVKDLLQNLLEPSLERRFMISEVLNSHWLFMDQRLIGMTEEESLALVRAKEQRQSFERKLLSAKVTELREVKAKLKDTIRPWKI